MPCFKNKNNIVKIAKYHRTDLILDAFKNIEFLLCHEDNFEYYGEDYGKYDAIIEKVDIELYPPHILQRSGLSIKFPESIYFMKYLKVLRV